MRFVVTITSTVEIEISDDVIALHKDETWVHDFYSLNTPEKIAEHLAYNVGLHDRDVNHLEGFADRSGADVTARIVGTDFESEVQP